MVFACAAPVFFAQEISAQAPAFGTVATVKARGKLVMITFPRQDSSFVAVNLETGPMKRIGTTLDFVGFDVDVMAGFAKWLHVPLEIRTMAEPGYGQLIPSLLRGEGDVIACAFSPTPERRKIVDFSDPYLVSYSNVIVRKESTISSLADLAGKKAATMAGSSQEERLRNLGIENLQFVLSPFTRDLYEAVREGQADFFMAEIDEYNLNTRLLRDYAKTLKVAFRLAGNQPWAYAVAPGSDLRIQLNLYLESIRKSGEFKVLVERHVPKPEPTQTAPVVNQSDKKTSNR